VKRRGDTEFFEDAESGALKVVMKAVGLLLLILTGSGVWLLFGLLAPAQVGELREIAPVQAALREYRGPMWRMESERRKIRLELERSGIAAGNAVTVFPSSPARLRLIAVECKIGFLLPGRDGLPAVSNLRAETLRPGRRLQVRVNGRGNGTGNAAYRAAGRHLLPQKFKLGEGERVEVKIKSDRRAWVEHWIPVTPGHN